MSHQTLKSFIDLVTFDQRLVEVQKQITSIQLDLDKNQQKKTIEEQRLLSLGTKKHDLQKAIHEQELSLGVLQEQENRLTQNLQDLSSTKEYDAATKELETLRYSRTTQEQKLTQQMNKLQTLEKDFAASSAQCQSLIDTLTTASQQDAQKIELLQQELQTIAVERAGKVVGIPKDWIESYDLMRDRVSNPVVPLDQDSCSACSYAVTPRDLQSIRKSAIIQCKDCYRFLYEVAVA